MDLVGYAAFSGLERVAIVAGAVIIGYWGYRLYVAEKAVGLVFMSLSVLVLVGTLATGASHVRSVGEGYQLASLTRAPADLPESEPAIGAGTAAAAIDPSTEPATEPSPFVDGETPAATGQSQGDGEVADAAPEKPDTGAEAVDDAPPEVDADSPVRLATGVELGGRIVSVKSENVSLEWSAIEKD